MMEDSNAEKQGLSEYSRRLSADAKKARDSYFRLGQENEKELNDFEISCESINKDFITTCLVSILADMTQEEREAFNTHPLDMAGIIELAEDKLNLSEEDKRTIKNELAKLTPEAMSSPSSLLKAFNLLDHESPLYKLKKVIYDSLQEKPEAAEAYSYLNLTS